ncbi:MAG: hypothetical protein U0487_03765 [Patescibacteria group bacterium]
MSIRNTAVDSAAQRVSHLAIKLQSHIGSSFNDRPIIESAIERLKGFSQLDLPAQVAMLDAVYADLSSVWSTTAPAMLDLCKIRDELSWIANRLAESA